MCYHRQSSQTYKYLDFPILNHMAGPYTYFLLGDGRNLKQIAIKLDGKARLGAVWCNVLATVLEGEISKTTHAWKSLMLCYINESSFLFFILFLLMSTIPTTLVIYLTKILVFNFLGSNFLAPKSDHRLENQLVLGPVWWNYQINIPFFLALPLVHHHGMLHQNEVLAN